VFLKEPKNNLQSGEFMVLCNFADNYSSVLQYEIPGFQWNNTQAAVYPFVIYVKKSVAIGTEHEYVVMISDCLKHDSILVNTFQWQLMKFIEKIVYFSNGSTAQYKSRKRFVK
jgi:hypothetical protein